MTYFFDRNIGRKIPRALALLDLDVVAHDDEFEPETPDDAWLAVVGARGWVVITQDGKIRKRRNELQAIIDHAVACFVLHTAGRTKAETARVFLDALSHIEDIVASERPPYVYRVDQRGNVQRFYP